jgi:branched-chain amino acid transport system permease protein
MQGREVIFEIRRIGMVAKATAIDVETGIEASVTGPANAAEFSLREAARRKLAWVRRRAAEPGAPGRRARRAGKPLGASLWCAATRPAVALARERAARRRRGQAAFMEYFVQQLINGLTLGAIYALIAIGYTMVYGIIGMINFAHGEIYMIGAFMAVITFTALGILGLSWAPAAILVVLVVAMLFTSAYGWTVERIAYRPLRGSHRLAPLISAIGMSIFLQNYVQIAQGAKIKPLAPVVQGSIPLMTSAEGFTVSISYLQLIIILLTVALMAGFTLLIQRTALGRAQRACEQDLKMASLLGVDTDRTISLTFVMGAALAAVAGVMITMYYGVIDFFIGFLAGVKAFTAAVLGGIGSLPGAMLGGLLIGLIEAMWSAYFSVEYKDVASFVILVVVLIFRPTGLLGRPEVEKV